MYHLNDGPTRQEVEHLHQLAVDATREDQFATMERLLEQAVQVAQRLDDLPLLIEQRSFLAYAQTMQSKHVEALATYSWLIGLATDPACSYLLTNTDMLFHFADAFMRFVSCGRELPAMPAEQLLRVVADGLKWLQRVDKASWASGLRSEKGRLLWMQGDQEGARLELETALVPIPLLFLRVPACTPEILSEKNP